MRNIRLGVNIDHVATVRNARGGIHPDPVRASLLALDAGADGITLHLREDRRHIREDDLRRLQEAVRAPVNLEMAATEEMVRIALAARPHAVCLVPERREEVTTEGGLDAAGNLEALRPVVARLVEAGIRVSLFIDPDERQVRAAAELGAPVVELHTGRYAETVGSSRSGELDRLTRAAAVTAQCGLECHAGHGLTFDNVEAVAALPEVVELNIGHFLIGEAIFVGLKASISEMKGLIAGSRWRER
ncbi:pyridoxine 5'-phosphate synthase [Mesorhizobium denitrificans]|jgi:pyridoxine 5-phosphate synthase|uniref:Pyridoxine 5'-phosphate synthase n=1 Tax=Mesorhizobium denitrificans TaxID=2294114 RepID=A0A371X9B4_9HYPH|nr:pyridoxine 5'-phosphate synthase [Mesorhizobium denitrificans]RFC65828.1 pyridoxine 5'-phosphate synthase [Mesorhizobium denitrificans]